jgi:peptidoglycan/LPS O-acetylase OafA/YrhL
MTRDYKIDVMRVFACIMVLFCHSPQPYINQPGKVLVGIDNYFGMAWGPILFFMISGACVLWSEREAIPFLKKRFSRILIPTILWSLVYIFVESFWWKTTPEDVWKQKIPAMIFEPQYGLMWFMYMLISIYLATPILSRWLSRSSRSEVRFFLLLWGVTLLIPFLKLIGIDASFLQHPNGYLYYFSGFLWTAVAGYYCRRYVHIERMKIWHVVVSVLIFLSPALVFLIKAKTGHLLNTSLSILSISTTAFAFILIYNAKLPRFLETREGKKWISKMSELSFGIYLTHMLFMYPFRIWIIQFNLNYAIQIPVTVIVVGACSFLISWVISKLPIGKYVIG